MEISSDHENGNSKNGGPQSDPSLPEEEEPDVEWEFTDSDNEVDDDSFRFDKSALERTSLGFYSVPCQANSDMSDTDEPYYPSSEELETDYFSGEENNFRFPEFCVETEKYDPKLAVGKRFRDIAEFKKAVKHYGIVSRTNIKFKVNNAHRAQGVCKEDCTWKIWASWNKKKDCVQIKSYNPNHTCSRDNTNRHCTYAYLAERYLEIFKVDPCWRTKHFIKRVKDDLKLKINRVTAWRTRRYAKVLIEGSDEHQFGLLRNFAAEIVRTNPGSTVRIGVNESKFQGIYVCLDACKKGFMSGCRQLVGLDGCFLKGTFGGQMLSAVALDANDCIYPIAYAIVEKENQATWRWFITKLEDDIGIEDNDRWTFMSDRQKGLQNVISQRFPMAEHRFCVRHMYTNFYKKDFKTKALKDYMWRAARATTVADFKMWMEEIAKEKEAAHNWLLEREPTQWSKSHFLTNCHSDILLNNLCECFNKTILEDREKSILTMLIDLHISFMKRIQIRRDKMRRVTSPLCPKIQNKLEKSIVGASEYDVDWSGGPQYYVSGPQGEFAVDLEARTCACRRWQLTGIPCSHAVAAIFDHRDRPYDYVHTCYKVETYLKCYDNLVNPINGKKLWPTVDAPPIKPPRWFVPVRGRKQTKRRRQAEEDVISQNGASRKMKRKGQLEMTCSVCGLKGHNKRYHKRLDAPDATILLEIPPQRVTPPASQQGPPTTGFQFMPTPGIGLTWNPCVTNVEPQPITPHSSAKEKQNQVQSSEDFREHSQTNNVSEMVEDLQRINVDEQAQAREARARNSRMVRASFMTNMF